MRTAIPLDRRRAPPDAAAGPDALRVSLSAADRSIAVALWIGLFVLLGMGPPLLGDDDAALFSAYTRRVLEGQVPYASFETYFSPGTLSVLGTAYAVFGFSSLVAMGVQAACQATLAALVFLLLRGLATRAEIALAAATAQVALGMAIWPHLSPHWFGCVGLLLATAGLAADWRDTPRTGNLVQGALFAFYAWLQHHKALLALPVVAVYLVADAWIFPPAGRRGESLSSRAAWIAAGFVVGAVLLFAPTFHAAGVSSAVDGLLVGPLVRYRRFPLAQLDLSRSWIELEAVLEGFPASLGRRDGLGLLAVIAWLAELGMVVRIVASSGVRTVVRRRALLVAAMLLAAAAGNGYRSAFVLQAFALPTVLVGAGFLAERWLAGLARRSRPAPLAALGLCAALVSILWTWALVRDRGHEAPHRAQTAFGPVAVPTAIEAERIEDLVARVHSLGMDHVYCHTYCSQLSLFTGLPNPTRYELLLPGMNTPEEHRSIIDYLDRQRDPYVGVGLVARLHRDDDPALEWIRDRYVLRGGGAAFQLWMRKDLAARETDARRLRAAMPASAPGAPARAPGT